MRQYRFHLIVVEEDDSHDCEGVTADAFATLVDGMNAASGSEMRLRRANSAEADSFDPCLLFEFWAVLDIRARSKTEAASFRTTFETMLRLKVPPGVHPEVLDDGDMLKKKRERD